MRYRQRERKGREEGRSTIQHYQQAHPRQEGVSRLDVPSVPHGHFTIRTQR